jgi:CRP-like cAMP-binding protein
MPSSRRLRKSQFRSIKPNKMFDPKEFLANVGIGRSIQQYGPKQTIFSQGKPADAVYYFQGGRVRLSVISKQGKEATIALLGRGDFLVYHLRSTRLGGNCYCNNGVFRPED